MTDLFAWRTELRPTPERAAQGAPFTGWVHEGHPPWRVIVFESEEEATVHVPTGCEAAPYDGTEATVTWQEIKDATGRRAMLSTEVVRALFGVYETWWHKVGTTDPGRHLVSDGVEITGVVLLGIDDDQAMETACLAVEPHEAVIRQMLGNDAELERSAMLSGQRRAHDPRPGEPA